MPEILLIKGSSSVIVAEIRGDLLLKGSSDTNVMNSAADYQTLKSLHLK